MSDPAAARLWGHPASPPVCPPAVLVPRVPRPAGRHTSCPLPPQNRRQQPSIPTLPPPPVPHRSLPAGTDVCERQPGGPCGRHTWPPAAVDHVTPVPRLRHALRPEGTDRGRWPVWPPTRHVTGERPQGTAANRLLSSLTMDRHVARHMAFSTGAAAPSEGISGMQLAFPAPCASPTAGTIAAASYTATAEQSGGVYHCSRGQHQKSPTPPESNTDRDQYQ